MLGRTLDRYVAGQFMRLFVLFVMATPVLFIVGDLAEHMPRYTDRGLGWREIGLSYVYQVPQFVLFGFPIAALIATVFTVNGMTRHSETVAAKAGGVSFYRLIAPLPLLGILLGGAALGLAELVPVTNRLHAEIIGERHRVRTARTDFVFRTRKGHVLSIRRLELEENRIRGITMERAGAEPAIPSIHITAERAEYHPEEGWTLVNGHLRLLAGPGSERAFRFQQLFATDFDETPEQLLAMPKDPDEMRYAELGEFIEVLERAGARPLALKVEQAQKISLPLATIIIIIFAAPLATTAPRGGAAYGIGISLGITLVYLMLSRVSGAAGATGMLSPAMAAWLPNLGLLGGSLILYVRVRT